MLQNGQTSSFAMAWHANGMTLCDIG